MKSMQQRERGSALILALIILLAISVIGIGDMESSVLQQKMVANQKNQLTTRWASDSLVEATVRNGNEESITAGHLYVNAQGQPRTVCLDRNGDVLDANDPDVDCDKVTIDTGSQVKAAGTFTYNACVDKPIASNPCLWGNSIDMGNRPLNCHTYDVVSRGELGRTRSVTRAAMTLVGPDC